jgi:hypothetical protein
MLFVNHDHTLVTLYLFVSRAGSCDLHRLGPGVDHAQNLVTLYLFVCRAGCRDLHRRGPGGDHVGRLLPPPLQGPGPGLGIS